MHSFLLAGEEVAYKPHVMQKITPVYKAPSIGSREIGLVAGVSVLVAVIIVIIVVVIAFNRTKKMRPRLRIRQKAYRKK